MSGPVVYADLETRSRCDLKAHGGRRYASDPSTDLLCGVAAVDRGEYLDLYCWGMVDPGPPEWWWVGADALSALGFDSGGLRYSWSPCLPWEVRDLAEAGADFVAHNAHGFDRHVWKALGYPEPNWVDSLELARRASLPGGLDAIGQSLFGMGKDKGGVGTLRMLMRPVKSTGEFLHPDGAQMRTLLRYCVADVLLMAAACDQESLLAPHIDDPVLAAHHAIDERGVHVDLDLARVLLEAEAEICAGAVDSAAVIFDVGDEDAKRMLRSNTALPRWLKGQGVKVEDVQASTLRPLLEHDSAAVRVVVRARLDVATVTAGKVRALLARVCADGRFRGGTAYCAASTGRWGGRSFQPQNLPRPPEGWQAGDVDAVKAGGLGAAERIAGSLGCATADVLSACLRGLLCAPAGYQLAQVDADQIEARVLLWLAGDEDGLEVFRRGDDPYTVQAEAIGEGTPRQVGKVAVLALGYGGSVGAFDAMATGYGLDVEALDVSEIVEGYRDSRPLLAGARTGRRWVVDDQPFVGRRGGLWKDLGKAATLVVASIDTPRPVGWGDALFVGRCWLFARVGDLIIRLPSGRELRYRNARIEHDPEKWGGKGADEIRFDGVKFGRVMRLSTYGGRLAENITQAVARDVLAAGLVALEGHGVRTVLTIHDEVLSEVDRPGDLAVVEACLATAPEWAAGLPLGAKGNLVTRYAK